MVRHGELLLERGNDGVECGRSIGCENDIIDIDKKVGNCGSMVADEQGRVALGGTKPDRQQEGLEPKKPRSRGLFQTIE